MPDPDPSPARYSLNIPVAVRERLASNGEWVRANGLVAEFTAAMREVEFRLSVEPLEWGEGRERLEHLDLEMRCGTCRMVTVLYGVNERNRMVVVKEFRINNRYRPGNS